MRANIVTKRIIERKISPKEPTCASVRCWVTVVGEACTRVRINFRIVQLSETMKCGVNKTPYKNARETVTVSSIRHFADLKIKMKCCSIILVVLIITLIGRREPFFFLQNFKYHRIIFFAQNIHFFILQELMKSMPETQMNHNNEIAPEHWRDRQQQRVWENFHLKFHKYKK